MKTTYWFVSYHTGTIGFDSAFIELESEEFDSSDALSEISRKKDIDKCIIQILYLMRITEEEYERNKYM